jgi:ribonuclease HI
MAFVGESLPLREVLQKYSAGPSSGVFTDGGARPNPGPGGWGVVYVKNGSIVAQLHGRAPDTTNNRMELTALIEAFKLLPPDEAIDVFSDSELCVNTVTKWAVAWEKRGWKRKDGPIKNLDLVQALVALSKERPLVKLQWIKAHNGWLWNEYADSLASAWTRADL